MNNYNINIFYICKYVDYSPKDKVRFFIL